MRRIVSLGRAVPADADAEADPPLVSCRIRCCPAMRRIVATFRLTSLIEFVMAFALLILLSPPLLLLLPLVEHFRAVLKVFNSSLANHKVSHNSNHSVHSLFLPPLFLLPSSSRIYKINWGHFLPVCPPLVSSCLFFGGGGGDAGHSWCAKVLPQIVSALLTAVPFVCPQMSLMCILMD